MTGAQGLLATAGMATALAGLAWLVDRPLARHGRHATRSVLWTLVVLQLALPVGLVRGAGLTDRLLAPLGSAALDARHGPSSEPSQTDTAQPGASRAGLPDPVAPAWVLGALLLGGWSLAAVARQRRRCRVLDAPALPGWWPSCLEQARRRAGLPCAPGVRWSDEGAGPAVLGALRPWIVLPRTVLDLGPHRVGLVLLHEFTHLRRRDTVWATLTWAVAVVWWWHPAAWLAHRRLADLRELGCDAAVLARLDGRRAAYGETLLAVASRRPVAADPAVAAAARHGLTERVEALLQPPRPSRRGVALATSLVLAWALAPAHLGAARAGHRGPDPTGPRPTHEASAAHAPSYAPVHVPAVVPSPHDAPARPGEPAASEARSPSHAPTSDPIPAAAPAQQTTGPTTAELRALLEAPGCLTRRYALAALATRTESDADTTRP